MMKTPPILDIEDDLNSLSIIRGNFAVQTVYGGQVVLHVEPSVSLY
jgi:hypothetical protein